MKKLFKGISKCDVEKFEGQYEIGSDEEEGEGESEAPQYIELTNPVKIKELFSPSLIRSIYVAADDSRSVEIGVTKDNKYFFIRNESKLGLRYWYSEGKEGIYEKVKPIYTRMDVAFDVLQDIETTLRNIEKRRQKSNWQMGLQ